MLKRYLLTAGPTPVPEEILLAMARPILYHRAPEFAALLQRVQQDLQWLFKTAQPVLTLAGSGTAGMEASVSNFLRRGDKALCIRGGKFGERWSSLCTAYGVQAVNLDVEWGSAVDPARVAEALDRDPAIRAVYATASETSTGVRHPVAELASLTRGRPDTLLVVDAITALGVFELPMDALGIDVLVTGSQKALMLPPGLAFVAASEKAWRAYERADLPRFYLDLGREKKGLAKGETAFTPAVSLVCGLQVALELLKKEGLEQAFARQARLARATRAACQALGLELFAQAPSEAVTAVKVPAGIDSSAVVKQMRTRYGVTIAGGQDHLKGKILRIAHLGWFDTFDIVTAISALEMALVDLGAAVVRGAGVAAAERELGVGAGAA